MPSYIVKTTTINRMTYRVTTDRPKDDIHTSDDLKDDFEQVEVLFDDFGDEEVDSVREER